MKLKHPSMYLSGVDLEAAEQLGDGIFSLDYGKGYLHLEDWDMLLPSSLHHPASLFLAF